MKKRIALLCLGLGLIFSTANWLWAAGKVSLKPIEQNGIDKTLGLDEQLWGSPEKAGDWRAMLRAIDHSLRYLESNAAVKAYQNYPIPGINRDRVRRSLLRFRELLVKSRTPRELQATVQKEFVFYQSVGNDDRGTVTFTGYFEPVYSASRKPTAEFRYPLYRKPSNFSSWSKPHPTRAELEGKDGLLGNKSPLAGYELVWLRDRLEAYLVHIQGSAKLQLTDGRTMSVGYDESTDYPYTSIGKELIKEGIFKPEELSLPVVIDYLKDHPQELDKYLPRNDRFVFFKETHGAPAKGSLGLPVTAERSIATDKSLMPPGSLALIRTRIPSAAWKGDSGMPLVSRYVLDQDTGSAIKGMGRVDIFMGTGKVAGDRAGLINHSGELYYLLLKNYKDY
ncbi:membrane-bound lytic murein transglycosylase [Pleurocapsa sp. PCC 7327]|uniref:murein transglycosylase A n=1 Tax=Pleurocapsa sp. PCC 7327 TaxID=118163 RepID=UPI00029FA5F2|nr:murein transglycosylase A [Pleurocapsa sp. PCC 7327]AFY76550.1 membrane-bound lytic murein transglycosylase [Pleurocapsa sp. PCC 7327]